MGNVQIAVRVPEQDLEQLDAAVARGVFQSRAAAVRNALERLLRELRELDIAEEYRRAYATEPADGEDKGVGLAGLELGAQLYAREESSDTPGYRE